MLFRAPFTRKHCYTNLGMSNQKKFAKPNVLEVEFLLKLYRKILYREELVTV